MPSTRAAALATSKRTLSCLSCASSSHRRLLRIRTRNYEEPPRIFQRVGDKSARLGGSRCLLARGFNDKITRSRSWVSTPLRSVFCALWYSSAQLMHPASSPGHSILLCTGLQPVFVFNPLIYTLLYDTFWLRQHTGSTV